MATLWWKLSQKRKRKKAGLLFFQFVMDGDLAPDPPKQKTWPFSFLFFEIPPTTIWLCFAIGRALRRAAAELRFIGGPSDKAGLEVI